MAKVTGIGGIFFKTKDKAALQRWYQEHLGVPVTEWGAMFEGEGTTVWSVFAMDSKKFEPSNASFMVNYRVDDLDALVTQLKAAGIEILSREDGDYGKFAWILDPEGNKLELWQPAPE